MKTSTEQTHQRTHGRDTRPRGIALNAEQARQLLGAIDRKKAWGERDFAMIILFFHTGLRVSEMAGLDVGHVATSSGVPRQVLHLSAATAKGGQARLVPLNAKARKAVAALLAFNRRRGFSVAPEAPLLTNRYHRRLPVRTIQFIVARLRERAQLDVRATPHMLRHSFAQAVMRKTGRVRALQALLGHSSLGSTGVYLSPTADDTKGVVAALE